jgi:DNA ligase-1
MQFEDLVTTSGEVAATRSRLAKREALAGLLSRAEPEDIEIVVAYLAGELRQRRTGVGWASLRSLPEPAETPSLTLAEIDAELDRISRLNGPGSATERGNAVQAMFARATAPEQAFLGGLISGEIRQGALDSAMLDAVAAASGVPLTEVRRAVMLRGATGPVALAALTQGRDAVLEFGLEVGQPIRPMLASTAPDIAQAMTKLGDGTAVSIDTKLDGIRVQVHKDGDEVRVFTRSLDDITGRLVDVEAATRMLAAERLILDGEAITLDSDGRPRPFQETASRTATQAEAAVVEGDSPAGVISPFFFDILHVDGLDVIDLPLRERLEHLERVVPESFRVSRLTTADPEAGEQFFLDQVSAGQEGVVLKSLDATYDAGRRGAAWIKVKPRHTLDLVVLAVEWGSGRRKGWLSNIHMGARDPETGGFVMLGKTFKGMTDEMLKWQTERFAELALEPDTIHDNYVVPVRPEQVVEIAFDGLQRSSRYPGGLALRFARVLRYRDDKPATEADTIDFVRSLAAPPMG